MHQPCRLGGNSDDFRRPNRQSVFRQRTLRAGQLQLDCARVGSEPEGNGRDGKRLDLNRGRPARLNLHIQQPAENLLLGSRHLEGQRRPQVEGAAFEPTLLGVGYEAEVAGFGGG